MRERARFRLLAGLAWPRSNSSSLFNTKTMAAAAVAVANAMNDTSNIRIS